jgi:hypothetical protein
MRETAQGYDAPRASQKEVGMSSSTNVHVDRERLARRIEEDRRLIAEMRDCIRQQRELVERVERSYALFKRALRRRGLIP